MNICEAANQHSFPFKLPDLPYAKDALAPHMSEETFNYHHGKHHKAYVDKLNNLIEGSDLASKSLTEIIHDTANQPDKAGIFNNAAQIWNHSFFWLCMKPGGGGAPSGAVAEKIKEDFGDFESFLEKFKAAGATQFGSGWAWLVKNAEGKLEVVKTANAESPMTDNMTPILVADVWEHAYYIDHKNARPAYLDGFMNNLVNWDFVNHALLDEGICKIEHGHAEL